jgi:hypothetical protein
LSSETPAPGGEAPQRRWRPNVFVIAFLLGVVVLTVLPLLQRRFLRAPAPVFAVADWSLVTTGGGISSAQLRGRVYLASFVPPDCDDACRARQEEFGRSLRAISDLDGGVVLVTFVAGNLPACAPGWYCAGGPGVDNVIESFRAGWDAWAHTDAGSTWAEFATLPGEAVVDQNGMLRGFWKDELAQRGNAINAARLLAEHGPSLGH